MEAAIADSHAAAALLASHGRVLLRRASRVSLCVDDAEDALQRALEIVLTRSPPLEPRRLIAWASVVVRREALALRRRRERAAGWGLADGALVDPERVLCERPDPGERLERHGRVAAAARLLARLKPDERRAIVLQAEGYSYAEIQATTGWTYTKTNRCLAEGRARLRQLGAMD